MRVSQVSPYITTTYTIPCGPNLLRLNKAVKKDLKLLRYIHYHCLSFTQKNKAWCNSGTRTPGRKTSGPGPPQSLKVGPGTLLKFRRGTPGSHSKFKGGIPGPPSKFKSGTFIIIFFHCLTYFVLDKYIDNVKIIFHEQSVF